MKGKKQLKIKNVGLEHLEQYNKLLMYVFQITNKDLSEIGVAERGMMNAKSPTLEKSDVIGWFDEETLVSQVAVYPMKVRIFNKTYDMGGLTGVGTYPEYAGMGLMSKLIQVALSNMQKRGQTISFLYPYSIPYYRKKGWEIVSDKISYEIFDYQLPKRRDVLGEVSRVDAKSDEVKQAYKRFAMQTHGALLRDDLAWNEYYLWDTNDLSAAVYYSENGDLDGYVLYRISEEVFHIKDMIFINEQARMGLWNFISAHFSMVEKVKGDIYTDETLAFLLEDADIKEIISPYFMARIVDAKNFIADYPFEPDLADRSWTFNLDDPIMDCNRGTFCLSIDKNGKGKLEKINASTNDRIDIQTLTTMLLGYKSPTYLHKIGRLVTNDDIVDMLEDAIEQQTPYFSDYF